VEKAEQLKKYRLSESEYQMIEKSLGRAPQGVEWALFSALWSEHCSYKSSKVHLKKLFHSSSRVVEGFGENAGVVDLGEGERVAFKIESHNHPSFIEPYQGAATGVGGILRDIFTMGARPIALANYLCFGEPDAPRMTQLVDGVVRGIGGYGNCVGVPTITGQTEFDSSYNQNILVNAMAVGLFRKGEKVHLSKASGPGNWVVYVGAKTGRDGVHGASMASESFDENSAAKRPTVQIGDPFYEKLLIESCLEVMKQDLVVAIQDMGAAGLTSSSFEMASKGGVGFVIDLDHVPLRDPTMTPEDVLLSESQERMLLVCEPKQFAQIQKIFEHWGLDACKIGEVVKKKTVTLKWHGETLTEIDPDLLVEGAPQYQRPFKEWKHTNTAEKRADLDWNAKSARDVLLKTLGDVRGSSRDWIYRQYDQRVGGQTVRDCSDSVGIVHLPDSGRALGVVLGCRPYVMRMNSWVGGADAIAYPALELAAKGFETLAVTDCLNFGNPEKEQTMTEFVAALTGMNSVCEKIKAPIISGNVSFYNETMGQNISPTPSTGLVGLRKNLDALPKSEFTAAGEIIYVLRIPGFLMTGAVHELVSQKNQSFGSFNAEWVAQFIEATSRICSASTISSSRVIGKFGLAYTLARMCMGGIGAKIDARGLQSLRGTTVKSEDLFHEYFYEIILSVSKAGEFALLEAFNRELTILKDLELQRVGQTGGLQLEIGAVLQCEINELNAIYNGAWKVNFAGLYTS
jgi:phosphoribosylformylglycinamidine synthase II